MPLSCNQLWMSSLITKWLGLIGIHRYWSWREHRQCLNLWSFIKRRWFASFNPTNLKVNIYPKTNMQKISFLKPTTFVPHLFQALFPQNFPPKTHPMLRKKTSKGSSSKASCCSSSCLHLLATWHARSWQRIYRRRWHEIEFIHLPWNFSKKMLGLLSLGLNILEQGSRVHEAWEIIFQFIIFMEGATQHNFKPCWPFIRVNRLFDSVICETSTFSMEPCEICWYVWVRKRSGWIDELWLHQAEIWLLQAVKGILDPSNITTYLPIGSIRMIMGIFALLI